MAKNQGKSMTSRLEEFIEKATKKFGDRFDYSKVVYVNYVTKVTIKCNKHGEFSQTPKVHLRSKTGCRLCGTEITAHKKTLTAAQFFAKASKFHKNKYNYIYSDFKSLEDDIVVICPVHKEFIQGAKSHLTHGCMQCRDDAYRYSLNEFIEKANEVYNNLYDYSKITNYVNNKIELEIICKEHGSFFRRGDMHLQGKGCPRCKKIVRHHNSFNNFVAKSNLIHDNFYEYQIDDFTSSNNSVSILCLLHGIFKQLAWQHMGGSRCPECVRNDRKLSKEEFLAKVHDIHGSRYDYSLASFNLVSDKIKIKCHSHGIFNQSVASHIKGQGCPKCSKLVSRGETEWLDSLNIPKSNRNKPLTIGDKVFFPDGCDFDNKIIYEFYGDYWHGNPEIYDPNDICKATKQTFGLMYDNTIKREKILLEAGYKLVIMWEHNWLEIRNAE